MATHGLASTGSAEDRLREIVREAVNASGMTQRAVAAELGISEQHLSRMLTGRSLLTLAWADRIARTCGRQLSVELTSPSAGAA